MPYVRSKDDHNVILLICLKDVLMQKSYRTDFFFEFDKSKVLCSDRDELTYTKVHSDVGKRFSNRL
jgi:hypothetical protein